MYEPLKDLLFALSVAGIAALALYVLHRVEKRLIKTPVMNFQGEPYYDNELRRRRNDIDIFVKTEEYRNDFR